MINSWIFYALICTFITGFEVANLKYLQLASSDLSIVIHLCFVLTGIVSLIYLLVNRDRVLSLNEKSKVALGAIGFVILLISSRFMYLKSVENSPNIGYTHMIINLNVIITIILAYLFFKQKINIYAFGGIILCLLGLFVIIKYS